MGAGSFVLGVVGGFGGGDAQVRFRDVDRDEIAAAFRQAAVSLRLDLPFCRQLTLRRPEDLHPDGLVERIPVLDKLLEARAAVDDLPRMRRLLREAGADVASLAPAHPETPRGGGEEEELGEASPAELLDAMLGDPGSAPAPARRLVASYTGDVRFDRMLQEIIEGSGETRDFAREDRWREAIDAELGTRVRAILGHPAFRRLDSSWASLVRLVRGADTGPDLRIRMLDLSQADFAEELRRAGGVAATGLHRAVVEGVEGEGIDALCTDYAIGRGEHDREVLAGLAALAERGGLPILAACSVDCLPGRDGPEAEPWGELREHPGARRIGLCAPRFLLRPPYEPASNPVERFAFSEGARVEDREAYLWGSAAFLLAGALLRAWASDGSLARVASHLEIEGLPIHVYREDGEVRYQGPTEVELSESAREAWTLAGVIPVTAVRGRDSARIASLRSLAGTPLFGGLHGA